MDSARFFHYDTTTGEVLQLGLYPLSEIAGVMPIRPGSAVFFGDFPPGVQDYTVDVAALEAVPLPYGPAFDIANYLVPRPAWPYPDAIDIAADGADEYVLSGLPAPTLVTTSAGECEVTDGELVITASVPAIYEVSLHAWPYLPKTITVTAHAP